ncbi:MAG: hypothetical protein ACD_54C00335G0003 [uncultured bacterium]|nr:MAG: hypothetical protein ACD_54C00335G0003 [uncultured bacterium]
MVRHALRIPRTKGARDTTGFVPRSFGFCPRQGILDPDQRQHQGQCNHHTAKDQKPKPRAPGTCGIGRDDPGQRHAGVACKLVQPQRQPALIGPRDVQLRRLGHRPAQPLIDAKEHGGRDDPTPAWGQIDHHRNRNRRDPAQEQHPLTPDAFRQPPGDKVQHTLDHAERNHEGGQQQE